MQLIGDPGLSYEIKEYKQLNEGERPNPKTDGALEINTICSLNFFFISTQKELNSCVQFFFGYNESR
jgi:hypothetical protein